MNAQPDDPSRAALRWGVYLLLIAVGTGGMLGRILAVNSVDYLRLEQHLKNQGRADWSKQRPFLSANDRSRWATVRALVEHGTYAIDDVLQEPNWDSIDIVKHDDQGRAAPELGEGRVYSSKPPLFATLMAGEYWVIYKLTGWTLGTHPYEIGRLMIVSINLAPLVVYFLVLALLVERFGQTDWGRMFTLAAAVFGTFLSTFVVSINNHLPAAVCAVIVIYAALRIVVDGERRLRWFALAGFFAAFMAANELPALSMFCLVAAWLLLRAPRETVIAFAPAAFLVAAASFGTNYAAHRTFVVPYAHRGDANNWYAFRYEVNGRVRESYWSRPENRAPIDQGEPSRTMYAVHVLAGHHGVFSLTPVWLLSLVGLAMTCAGRPKDLRGLGWIIAICTMACFAFYLSRGQIDRNYGGMTSGMRWFFWLAPAWLLVMLPAADAVFGRRWLQAGAVVLLALSVMSSAYPTWNPWTQPWLFNYLEHLGVARLGPH